MYPIHVHLPWSSVVSPRYYTNTSTVNTRPLLLYLYLCLYIHTCATCEYSTCAVMHLYRCVIPLEPTPVVLSLINTSLLTCLDVRIYNDEVIIKLVSLKPLLSDVNTHTPTPTAGVYIQYGSSLTFVYKYIYEVELTRSRI